MARSVPRSMLCQLRALFTTGTAAGWTDVELLERFVERRDAESARDIEAAEAAFAALVERHGPMVWGACVRVLGSAHEAEDAFQATFLVLARSARTVRGESLRRWLYGVARKVARRARRQAERRRSILSLPASGTPGDPAREAELGDLRTALGEELGRLRAECRAAIELCHLQGLTQDEAARRLGCSKRTVKSRLSAGRRRLRARLEGRGFASAAVPVALARSTLRIAMFSATGEAGAFPASIAALATGVMRAMFLNKLTIAVVLVVATTGAAVHAFQREENGSPANPSNNAKPGTASSSQFGQAANRFAAQPSGAGPYAGLYDPGATSLSSDRIYKDAKSFVEAVYRLEQQGRRDEALAEVEQLRLLVEGWERSIRDATRPTSATSAEPVRAANRNANFQYSAPQRASSAATATASPGADQERRIQRLEGLIEKLLDERTQRGQYSPLAPPGRQ